MKSVLSLALCAALLLSGLPAAYAQEPPEIGAACAVVMNIGGELIYTRGADEQRYVASTTKLMTALVAAEEADLDEQIEILPDWCGVEGSSMYLHQGDRYTLRELLYGLLLVSGNDAARALACHISGSEEAFAEKMNEKARQLGMEHSSFANPHGLDKPGFGSTAGDLALLMRACLEQPDLREILAMGSAQAGDQILYNHNKLLWRCPGCLGGKTGYTEAAGRCLVSACERDGTRLICVTLDDPDDWSDHMALYDWAYAAFGQRSVVDAQLRFEVPVFSGDRATVGVVPSEECSLFLPNEAELVLVAEMPRYVFAPVRAGTEAGRILITLEGETLRELPLLYAESVQQIDPSDRRSIDEGKTAKGDRGGGTHVPPGR